MLWMIIILSAATAVITLTVTKAVIFRGLRLWVATRSEFFGELLSCAYCFSHWAAFLMVAATGVDLFNVGNYFVGFFLTSFALTATTAPIIRLVYWAHAGIPAVTYERARPRAIHPDENEHAA